VAKTLSFTVFANIAVTLQTTLLKSINRLAQQLSADMNKDACIPGYIIYTFLVTKALAHDVRAAVGPNIFL